MLKSRWTVETVSKHLRTDNIIISPTKWLWQIAKIGHVDGSIIGIVCACMYPVDTHIHLVGKMATIATTRKGGGERPLDNNKAINKSKTYDICFSLNVCFLVSVESNTKFALFSILFDLLLSTLSTWSDCCLFKLDAKTHSQRTEKQQR